MCDSEYASFLIRCWLSNTTEESANWQGEVEHIQSGHTVSIQSLEELVAVLNEWPRGPETANDNNDV